MADPKVKLKRSAVGGRIPSPDQVPLGELALNTWDGQLYASRNVGVGTSVVAINPWIVGTGTDSYNIYYTAGNAGIGTTIPRNELHVNGDIKIDRHLNVTGIVTASSFVGTLTGTATGLSGTPGIAVTNVTGFGFLRAPHSATTTVFKVTVASQDATHRYNGTGSSNKYLIDGVQSPFLTLTPGRTYRFDQSDSSNSSHPLRFYLEVGKTTQYSTNVTTNGTAGSAGAYTEITVTDTTPSVLHYQCTAHANMGNAIFVSSNALTSPHEATIKNYLTVDSGATLSGVTTLATATATSVVVGSAVTLNSNGIEAGLATINYVNATHLNATGVVTANSFIGDGSNLTGITGGVFATNQTGIHTLTNIGIGTTSAFNALQVTGDANISGVVTATSFTGDIVGDTDITGNVTIISTDAGSSAEPELKLYRNSASPADADYLGQIKFAGESDTGVERNYAKITGKILDASNGTEDGIIEFAHIKAGSQNISARFRSDSLQLLNDTNLTVAGETTLTGQTVVGSAVTLSSSGIEAGLATINYINATHINAAGVVTATSFVGDGSGLTGITASGSGVVVKDGGSLVGTAGTINFGTNLSVTPISAGVVTVTASGGSGSGFFVQNQTGIHTIGNVGIGTTTATGAADSNNTSVLNAGIVTANYYYGDGSNLSGVGGQITVQDSGVSRGTPTTLNFASGIEVTTASGGISTITATAGSGSQGVSRNITDFTATAGQTTFTVSYTAGRIEVFLNGSRLRDTTDYTATNGSSVVLTSSAAAGDELSVVEYLVDTGSTGISGKKTTSFTATAGQTTFTVAYTVGAIDVFRNGIRLVSGDDYTATNGTSVVLVSGASVGDSVVVAEYQGLLGNNQTGINTTSNLGIGTTSAYNALTVVGDANISGVLTATTLYGNGANLTGIQAGFFVQNQTGIHTTGNIGVGTTSAFDALSVTGNANITGVVTASAFYGDGSNLDGVVSGVGIGLSTYNVGYAQTTIEFIGSGVTAVSIGNTTQVTIEPGLVGAAKSVTSFTATAGQTAFNVDHSTGQENVFLNGVRLSESQYTTNGSTITLNDAAALGDVLDIIVYLRGSDPNRNIEVNLRPPFNGVTTAFTMYRGTSDTLFDPVDQRQILVSLGGVVQHPGIAYTVGAGSSLYFAAAPGAGVTCFITGLFSSERTGITTDATKIETQVYNPTGAQTAFTLTRGYEQNYLNVYLNGARLVNGQDFTATDSSTFNLTVAANVGDVVEAVAFRTVGITSAVTAGISSNVDGDYVNTTSLSATGISTLGNVVIGAGGTDLLVKGNGRVTGILTIGESSLSLAGAQDANTITIGSTERVRFFDDGRTIFGSSTDKGAFNGDQKRVGQYQFVSTNYLLGGFYRYGADGTQVSLGCARGTEASPSQLNNDDYSGILQFKGHTGTYFADMASIRCRAEEALTNSGSGAEIVFGTAGTGSTSVTDRIKIRHNGSLECRGDANPNALFDRGSANSTNLNINYNGTLRGQLSGGASHFQISASGSGSDIEFFTEGNAVGRWDNDGLEISDPSAAGWAIFESDGGTTSARGRAYSRTHASCSGVQEIYQHYLGSTEKLRLRADGNITNANNSYGSLSDQKLKENIVDASSQWEDIKNITIRNFNFKASTGHDTSTMIGVVAQELELVSPGLVEDQVDREFVNVPVLDEDGNAVLDENGDAVTTEEERETGTVTKTVKTSVLHMKAVKALQEAMARIESLEAQVTALQNSVGIAST